MTHRGDLIYSRISASYFTAMALFTLLHFHTPEGSSEALVLRSKAIPACPGCMQVGGSIQTNAGYFKYPPSPRPLPNCLKVSSVLSLSLEP